MAMLQYQHLHHSKVISCYPNDYSVRVAMLQGGYLHCTVGHQRQHHVAAADEAWPDHPTGQLDAAACVACTSTGVDCAHQPAPK